LIAGEGSVRERGLRPLSKFLPFSNRLTFYLALSCCLRGLPARSRFGEGRGIKGVSLNGVSLDDETTKIE